MARLRRRAERLPIHLDELPQARALAALGEPAAREALEVLLALLELEGSRDAHAFLDAGAREALAREDDERLEHLGGVAGAEDEVLGLVEMLVDHLAALGMMVEHPLQVLHPVAHVPGLVLHHQPEELLVGLGGRDVLAEAEEREDHALGLEVQRERRLGEYISPTEADK